MRAEDDAEQPRFAEALPESCPPGDATSEGISIAYRVVQSNPPCAEDFSSKAALGHELPPGTDPCRFASCSLFSRRKEADGLCKLPNFTGGNFIAELEIPEDHGMHKKKKKHIDFWAFYNTSLEDFVVSVEEPQE